MKGVCTTGAVVAVLLGLCAPMFSAQAQQPPPAVRELTVGHPIDSTLSGGDRHAYHLSIEAGQFVDITVEQRGINLIADLLRPDGSLLHSAKFIADELLPETIVIVADASGVFTVDVHAANRAAPAGAYQVRLNALRPPGPVDTLRIQAERTYERARVATSPGVLTEFPHAIDDLKAAQALYRQAEDRAGELKALLAEGLAEYVSQRPESLQ